MVQKLRTRIGIQLELLVDYQIRIHVHQKVVFLRDNDSYLFHLLILNKNKIYFRMIYDKIYSTRPCIWCLYCLKPIKCQFKDRKEAHLEEAYQGCHREAHKPNYKQNKPAYMFMIAS